MKFEVGCIVRDRQGKQYRVAEIIRSVEQGTSIVIYPMKGYGRLIGSLSDAEKSLEVIRDAEGYDKDGYDYNGYDRRGFDWRGFDKDGYNRDGRDIRGFDRDGFDRDGYDKSGFNKKGYNREGKHRSQVLKLPNYTGSCYAGAHTSWPGAQRSKKRR